jgi:hypothetical protein
LVEIEKFSLPGRKFMRKETVITIDDNGNALKFRVKQMPATKLYDFMVRALLTLAASGVNLGGGDDIAAAGRYLQEHGLSALGKVEYSKAKPLLDELLACCSRLADGGVEQLCTPDIMDGFISDVRTIFKLQVEAVKINFNFFGPGEEKPSSSPETLNMGKPTRAGA